MSQQRRGGLIQLKINGELQDAKGAFTYNPGRPKREAIVGADGIHGYTETPQPGYIEGAITDRGSLNLSTLVTLEGATVTLELANGKVFVLRDAWYAGDGEVSTEQGEIQVRFEGSGEEV